MGQYEKKGPEAREGRTVEPAGPTIVSCSRRTDVPAFYGKWFENRLRAGFAEYRTSYSPVLRRVSLARGDVAGFLFWSKNPVPFEPTLAWLAGEGRPWAVHFTITGLPRVFEPRVPGDRATVPAFRRLAGLAGPKAMFWRYDPIVISPGTPPAWHVETFRRLAGALAGYTEQVFLSFAAPYRRTVRNTAPTGADLDPAISLRADLVGELCEIARDAGMTVNACCNPELLPFGPLEGQCISPARLSAAWGIDLSALPPRPSRPRCRCVQAFDVGAADSCPGGCLYCYANQSPTIARRNHAARHDPAGACLLS